MTQASIGYLSEFWLEDPATGVLTQMLEARRIQLPTGAEFDETEATHLQSPDRWREFIDTMRTDQRFEVEINKVSGSETDRIIRAAAAVGSGVALAARIREFDGYRLVSTHDFDVRQVRFADSDLETEEVKLTTLSYRIASLVETEYPLSIAGTPPEAVEGEAYSFTPEIRNGFGPYTVTAIGFTPLDYGITLEPTTGAISATTLVRDTPMLIGALQVTDSSSPQQTATLVLSIPIAESE